MAEKKTILVTGGAGFIGSHLVERLLRDGHRVLAVDNFFTGRHENLAHLKGDRNLVVITHDITEPLDIAELVDEVYNLACPASPKAYQEDPVKTVQTNVLGAINVLEFARERKIRILQASTSEVYGDPLEHPQRESYWGNVNPLSPRACYDEGKRCAETLFMDYHREYGVDIRIIRIFNTYGPRMAPDDGRVVSNFIVQALAGRDITIYGEGTQTRSFQYVDDLVAGMVRMMEQNEFIGPVNLGNPGEFTIKELAEKVISLTGASSALAHEALPQDDPKQRKPDISIAKQKLGWEPEVTLDQGLIPTIEYFRGLQ